jgi:hypothetical protein
VKSLSVILLFVISLGSLGYAQTMASNKNSMYLSAAEKNDLHNAAIAYYQAPVGKDKAQALKTWDAVRARILAAHPGKRLSKSETTLIPLTAPKHDEHGLEIK